MLKKSVVGVVSFSLVALFASQSAIADCQDLYLAHGKKANRIQTFVAGGLTLGLGVAAAPVLIPAGIGLAAGAGAGYAEDDSALVDKILGSQGESLPLVVFPFSKRWLEGFATIEVSEDYFAGKAITPTIKAQMDLISDFDIASSDYNACHKEAKESGLLDKAIKQAEKSIAAGTAPVDPLADIYVSCLKNIQISNAANPNPVYTYFKDGSPKLKQGRLIKYAMSVYQEIRSTLKKEGHDADIEQIAEMFARENNASSFCSKDLMKEPEMVKHIEDMLAQGQSSTGQLPPQTAPVVQPAPSPSPAPSASAPEPAIEADNATTPPPSSVATGQQ